MRAEEIILGPVLSEKAVGLSATGVYCLRVSTKATKCEIKSALKQAFSVDALTVNTSIGRGKEVRRARSKRGGAVMARRPNFKHAFVTLKSGQSLPTPVLATDDGTTTGETK